MLSLRQTLNWIIGLRLIKYKAPLQALTTFATFTRNDSIC